MHLSLLGGELPIQYVGDGSVEGDFDALGRSYGYESARDILVVRSAGAVGADRLAAPPGGLTNLSIESALVLKYSMRGSYHLIQRNRAISKSDESENCTQSIVPRNK